MHTTARLLTGLWLLTAASSADAQVRVSSPQIQTAFRTTWTAVLPQPATIAAVTPSSLNIPVADLRPTIARFGPRCQGQGNRPTCSVHAMTFLLEYMAATAGHNNGNLSEEYLNAVGNRAVGQDRRRRFLLVLDQGRGTASPPRPATPTVRPTTPRSSPRHGSDPRQAGARRRPARLRFLKPSDRSDRPERSAARRSPSAAQGERAVAPACGGPATAPSRPRRWPESRSSATSGRLRPAPWWTGTRWRSATR